MIDYILIQSDNSLDFLATIKHLADTNEYVFDLSLDWPRIQPVLFEYRVNMLHEQNWYYFIGELVCTKYSVAVWCKYLGVLISIGYTTVAL